MLGAVPDDHVATSVRLVPTYFACRWEHDSDDDPVVLYEELDDERMEARKVHQYRDGTMERADRVQDDVRTTLSCMPIPPLGEIEAQPEFTVLPLSVAEFERSWQAASEAT